MCGGGGGRGGGAFVVDFDACVQGPEKWGLSQ